MCPRCTGIWLIWYLNYIFIFLIVNYNAVYKINASIWITWDLKFYFFFPFFFFDTAADCPPSPVADFDCLLFNLGTISPMNNINCFPTNHKFISALLYSTLTWWKLLVKRCPIIFVQLYSNSASVWGIFHHLSWIVSVHLQYVMLMWEYLTTRSQYSKIYMLYGNL